MVYLIVKLDTFNFDTAAQKVRDFKKRKDDISPAWNDTLKLVWGGGACRIAGGYEVTSAFQHKI
jgi:hypothetical protein